MTEIGGGRWDWLSESGRNEQDYGSKRKKSICSFTPRNQLAPEWTGSNRGGQLVKVEASSTLKV